MAAIGLKTTIFLQFHGGKVRGLFGFLTGKFYASLISANIRSMFFENQYDQTVLEFNRFYSKKNRQ